jgi:ABC-type phosphate transport system substrate-binding protein
MPVKSTLPCCHYFRYLLPGLRTGAESHRMRHRCIRLLVGALLVVVSSLVYAKQLAVVTDTANPATNVSSADLLKIFNLHMRAWADGKPIIIVMRDPSAGEMQLLLRKVLNMSPDQARMFIQSHKGSIVIADSDDAVIRFVSSNRGAVGVIDLYSLTKDVNVLKIDGKLPVEQGYLLRGNEP